MTRLLVFDLDSTLAPIGAGIGKEEIELLKELENMGVNIAICSGKTCDYLCGFMRQVELKNPILIGENGAVIRFGIELPPKRHFRVPFSKEAENSLKEIKNILEKEFPHIWFQPNKVGVTPFPTTETEFDEIEETLKLQKEKMVDVNVYRHIDSFDIVPAEINKAKGIQYLLSILDITASHMIAIGDGVNDYSMFALAGFSVGVNVKEEHRVNINCTSTLEMLKVLKRKLEEEKSV